MLPHNYGSFVFRWNEETFTCTVSYACADCGDTVTDAECDEITHETATATCTVKGDTIYTAHITVNGTDYTIGQVLRYKDSNGNTSLARFYFNIHITNTRTGVELRTIELEEQPNAIQGVEAVNNRPVNVFSVDGRLVKTQAEPATALHGLSRGFYIIDGKKYLVK